MEENNKLEMMKKQYRYRVIQKYITSHNIDYEPGILAYKYNESGKITDIICCDDYIMIANNENSDTEFYLFNGPNLFIYYLVNVYFDHIYVYSCEAKVDKDKINVDYYATDAVYKNNAFARQEYNRFTPCATLAETTDKIFAGRTLKSINCIRMEDKCKTYSIEEAGQFLMDDLDNKVGFSRKLFKSDVRKNHNN